MTTKNIAQLTCGQALVKLLEAYGVDTVFGIPGVHTLDLYDGLSGSPIQHVLARHEQGAGFMADGYARVTGKPGVCFTITGPGVTNIATPMGQAFADSIPMLVISSVNKVNSMGRGRGELHETKDQRAITVPITAFSATAYSPSEVPALIARAFSIFCSERPRPVFIELPLDVINAPIDEHWLSTPVQLAPRPAPQQATVQQAITMLSQAKKPVIIAGGGAIAAGGELQHLAEQLAAGVFTTVAAKGLLPVSHPLYAGSTLCVEPSWQFLADADVVLAVGTELAETDMWREKLPLTGKLIRVDIDPEKMNDLYLADLPIIADAGCTLAAFNQALAQQEKADSSVMADNLSTLKAKIQSDTEPLQHIHQQVLQVIANVMPTQGFISADMTQIAYTGNYLYNSAQARSWLHPTGYGTLGYALPAGIGAKFGAPDRPGLVLAGDGGILYTIQELATATEELSSPLVILLWNNDSLGQIRDDMVAQGIEPIGVNPKTPDFIDIARGFGCQTAKPDSLAALESSLHTALAFNGVTLIQMNQNYLSA
ncbi:acetolactate synthase, large subunit [Colwellia chukchiensis]|uniref:Acetolactate synthase, large subunit n=1 Tax=Colwellia chukchiensis TaxID=641665 RepID=A0A1H7I1Y5_9GAMM|nr:5-guanidino-2-oxopentanoate decarboxylase [Colwellia chukchiensis]SEK55440.1 acetolactate synthase, large subunit [Colwellia chukchiensis]